MTVLQGIILWKFGEPDGDYREFALAGRYGEYLRFFPDDVRFQVGQSKPGEHWCYIHPGPADAWAGARRHPFRILFHLDEVPQGVCRLTLRLVNTHYAVPPVLEVRINEGYSCRFRLPAGGGDTSLTDPKTGRPHTLSFLFSRNHLRVGENSVILTVAEGSWLLYDAISLEGGLPLPETPDVQNLSAETTMLFRRIAGELKQAVRIWLNNVGVEGEAEAGIDGFADSVQKVTLKPGENTLYLFLPPLEHPQKLRLWIRATNREWTTETEGRPERRWKVFVAPSSHTDIGYTDWQERVFLRHNENTLRACDACDENPHFKWNLEVAFQAFLFRQSHPTLFWRRLVPRLRERRIGLQGLYLNMLTGLCSGEEMVRVVSRAQVLARSCGLGPVTSANLSDVPTAVGTLPMFLAQAGVRYFAEAVNQYHAPVFSYADPRLVQSPFWWEGLDGSRVLAILTDSYGYVRRLSLTSSPQEIEAEILRWLRGFATRDYPCDAVYAYGGFFDNEPLDPRYADAIERWNSQWEYPHIMLCTVDEFFRYVEKEFGKSLPVFRGDFGVYWEDGAASTAYETALVRWAKQRLETAERWLALTRLHHPARVFPLGEVESAWEEVIFSDEHTWGAWCSVSEPESEQTKHQWEFKAEYARRAAEKAEALERRAQRARTALMEAKTTSPPAGAQAVVVWNEFSWQRDIAVTVSPPGSPRAWHIRDVRSGKILPVQHDGSHLIFLAERVPSMGYASFLLERGEPPLEQPLLRQAGDRWTWAGAGLHLQIDPGTGAIKSLKETADGREWVDPRGGYGLNQFIYVLGGEGTRLMHPHLAEPKYEVFTHNQTSVEVVENGILRAVLHLRRTGRNLPPLDTWLTVWWDSRLEFFNVLHKEATLTKEAGYFAFPFRFAEPKAIKGFVELPYGILQVEGEQLPGGCREWYATHSFAALSDGRTAAYLATPHAPLLTFNDFFKGLWRGKIEGLNGSLFAYVFNNYWDTNYKASQGGEMVFGFTLNLRDEAFDPTTATRFGWESLATMRAPSDTTNGPLQEATTLSHLPVPGAQSLLQVYPPDGAVVVGGITWEDERLYIRLYNTGTAHTPVQLEFSRWTPREAWRTDLVGRPQERLSIRSKSVKVHVPARGVVTLALR
ncbi:MAG: polysaccharide lyase family protein [Armatimonadota bacterium]